MVASYPKRASGVAQRGAPPTGAYVLTSLRQATRAAHAAVERSSPLLRDDVTREVYARYLAHISPLVAAAERFAVACAEQLPNLRYDFAAVGRHAKLRADLASFGPRGRGAATSSVAGAAAAPRDRCLADAKVSGATTRLLHRGGHNTDDAGPPSCNQDVYTRALQVYAGLGGRLGVLYVLEGSTLGGQVLCRQLKDRLQLAPHQLRYLAGHGRATGARWRATCALLEAALSTPALRAQAGAAAAATFRLFKQAVAPTGRTGLRPGEHA